MLLVGGASRRFGSPKALARFGSETLAERAWRLLGAACRERVAVGKEADRLPLPFALRDDGSDTRAPIAGVVAGLRLASHAICVVVPVDMPWLTAGALQALVAGCDGVDVAVPASGPLPGAYRKTALPVLERRLERGELALWQALRELRVATVPLDERVLANINAPDDLASARAGASHRPTAS